LNVVSISQTTEFFLSSGIPSVETNLSQVGMECDRMHFTSIQTLSKKQTFDTESSDVFFLKFTSKMSLDEGGLNVVSCDSSKQSEEWEASHYLSGTAITDEDEFKSWDLFCHYGSSVDY
jgi:hypothetical protein